VSWLGFFFGGLHPALALVPIMPFLPHAARDPGFFVDADPNAKDTLSRFEIVWRYPAQITLFFFGLVNAGVRFQSLEAGTWALPIAVIAGKPIGVLVGSGLALAGGLHLPRVVGWRELLVVGLIASIGFSMALFFTAAFLPPGQLRAEMSMGAMLTLAAAPLAFMAAWLLGVGRFHRGEAIQ
jgi:NhaA family Na+:H+ antiporter